MLDNGIDVPLDKDEFQILCPLHHDTRASCSINVEKGVWICYAGCGQGSLEYLIQKMLQLSRTEIQSLLMGYEVGDSLSFLDSYSLKTDGDEKEMVEIVAEYDLTRVPSWIFDRGFETSTLLEWECGADLDGDLVMPVRDIGKRLVGTVVRRQNLTPKYLYSKGLRKSRLLFGGYKIQPCDFVCVTEGSLDAIWLDQNKFPAVSILGANLSKYQEDLLLQLPTKEIVLCLDNDRAGEIGTQNALTTLSDRCRVSRINLNIVGGYKDVQDVRDIDHLKTAIQNRTYW